MRNWKETRANSKEQIFRKGINPITRQRATGVLKTIYKIKPKHIFEQIKEEARAIEFPDERLQFYKVEYENFIDEYEYELESGNYTHLNIIDRLFKKKIESLKKESNPQTVTTVKRGVIKTGASDVENVSKESIIYKLIDNLVKEKDWNLIEKYSGNKKNQKWLYTEMDIYKGIKEHLPEDHKKGSVIKSIQYYRGNLLKKSKKTKE